MVRPVVGALALLLALTACGGDPKADPSPTPSTPVTTPVSTTPAAPVMPEAAKANTSAGALEFVRFYVTAFNHSEATGDVRSLVDASADECESCISVIDKVRDLYTAGGYSEGGQWRLVEVRVTSVGHPWRVAGRVSYGPQRVVQPGQAEANFKAGEYDMEFTLQRAGERWQVRKWVRH
jgi:hypothetical protein